MAMNPMQRKARQSFFLGVIITLLLAAVIIAFMFIQMKNLKDQVSKDTTAKVKVYVLKQDVKSGQTLTADMFEQREVTKNAVPADATNVATSEKKLMAKVDMKANTILTSSMATVEGEEITKDVREQTYNMIALPIDLVSGDYVDIRFMLPNGTDFIVLSKLKVTIPDINGVYVKDTIKVNVTEEQLLTMSSAIVEAYKISGSKLYAIKYAEAGNQEKATITYEPRKDIVTLIKNNPNIVNQAISNLYNNLTSSYRKNQIDGYFNSGDDSSIESGIKDSTEKTQKSREEYLDTVFAE